MKKFNMLRANEEYARWLNSDLREYDTQNWERLNIQDNASKDLINRVWRGWKLLVRQ